MKKRFLAGLLTVSITISGLFTGCAKVDKELTDVSTGIEETTAPNMTAEPTTILTAAVTTESTTTPTAAVTTEPTTTQATVEATEPSTIPVTESTTQPTATADATEPMTEATAEPTIPVIIIEQEENTDLSTSQRNSLNMLNYITVLTQTINESKNSRICLDSAKSALSNNIYPNAVDSKTKGRINSLWHTIDEYRMVSVKRERLAYLYEQNRAQALRKAIPNPMGLLSAVESGSRLKTIVSVLYMAADAAASYKSASTEADLEYLKEGWELDDAEAKALSDNQLELLNYMIDMVRDNDFPGEYALTEDAVKNFAKWSNEDNLTRKINWFKANEETYKEFRTYWLERSKSYYEAGEYAKCLADFRKYEEVATRIFRKDYDYAKAIPMAIVAARATMSDLEYEKFAEKYIPLLLENCAEDDWLSKYVAAQIYIDLSARTGKKIYLWEAYQKIYENVNILVDEQEALNIAYLSDVQEKVPEEGCSKREKKEIKQYNELLKETRKKELPPVSEAFYLNCELLFALAEKVDIPQNRRVDIDQTIHENDSPIFLTEALDHRFWATKTMTEINSDDIEVEFNGKELVVPASCLTARSVVTAMISDGTVLDDWIIEKVDRPKGSTNCNDFMVIMTTAKGKDHDYAAGESIKIRITPVADTPGENLAFKFNVVPEKKFMFLNGVAIERTRK